MIYNWSWRRRRTLILQFFNHHDTTNLQKEVKWKVKFSQDKHKPDKPPKKSTPNFLTCLTNSAAGRHCEEAGTPPHETNPYFYLLHCQGRRTICLLGLDTQFIVLLEKWDTCGDHGMAKMSSLSHYDTKTLFVIEPFVGLAIRAPTKIQKTLFVIEPFCWLGP